MPRSTYSTLSLFSTDSTMATIDVDFEVFKALTLRRRCEEMTENDVIRELLGLPLPDRCASTAEGNAPEERRLKTPSKKTRAGASDAHGTISDHREVTVNTREKYEAELLGRRPWFVRGVAFPHGTRFRAHHHGQLYEAVVNDGALVYQGKRYSSPSAAARAITGYQTNGWIFWECMRPGSTEWTRISRLRRL